jgi:hypothetical protein
METSISFSASHYKDNSGQRQHNRPMFVIDKSDTYNRADDKVKVRIYLQYFGLGADVDAIR